MVYFALCKSPFVLLQRTVIVLLFTGALTACSDSSDSYPDDGGQKPESRYSALVERTEYGTAHITADDWGSLGFGQGYAFAQDRFCVLADQILKVRSERARYLGAGEDNEHVVTDFAYLGLGVMENAGNLLGEMSADGREMLEGYVAGFNQYLEEIGVDQLPGECAGQEWVQPIDATSLMAYYLDVAMLAGSRNFLDAIANAAPPGNAALSSIPVYSEPPHFGGASNGVALGRQRTGNGRGLLLSNTHLPWVGELRYQEVHLTLPGEIDVAGVTLSGVIGVLMGFNESLAWTHTTSPSNQFIIYTLDLLPGDPTRYYFGEEERDMESRSYTVEVLEEDGTITEQSRTLYTSHYGPMIDPSAFGLSWSGSTAFTIFDMNAENFKLTDTFRAMGRTSNVDELREVFETVGGVPWNHTMATDKSGEVLYADTTLVPNLSKEAEAEFTALVEADGFSFTKVAFGLGVVVLDGSDPLFSIEMDERATLPGAIPFQEAPQLTGRKDFVLNANDSYWLSNPDEPLSGYSLRYGDSESVRSLRTRMGLTQLSERDAWDRDSLKAMLFANPSYTEHLWRDQLADYCVEFDEAEASKGQSVDIQSACQAIVDWDGHYNLESRGAIVFREMMSAVDSRGGVDGKSYFTEPFDVLEPVATPRGLSDEGEDYFMGALADAVLTLEKAGIPQDAPLGDYQYTMEGDQRFSVHGGRSTNDGAFNIVTYTTSPNTSLLEVPERPPVINASTGLTEEGYFMNYGASFIMSVEFTDEGPVADAILTYSQSDDPASPHFRDQMSLYSEKSWRPLQFSREQIESDPALTSERVESATPE